MRTVQQMPLHLNQSVLLITEINTAVINFNGIVPGDNYIQLNDQPKEAMLSVALVYLFVSNIP